MTKYDGTGVFVDYDDLSNKERIELKRHDRISYSIDSWTSYGEPIIRRYFGVVAKVNSKFGIYFEDNLSFYFIPFSRMGDPAEDCKLIRYK